MDELAERFEQQRDHLSRVAYRMLGSASEADDAVQEAWLRLSRSDATEVENLGGWLTTVVARVCLDQLRSRKARREVPADEWLPELTVTIEDGAEEQALLADAVGVALLVVLEALTPAERLAFVLHDMFAVPFSEIADILDRTPEAARQLASRARRRVRGTTPRSRASVRAQRELVDAFLVAARDGDFDALVGLLAPDVVFRVRGPAVRAATVRGAEEVARRVLRRGAAIAPHARPVLVNGWPGALVGPAERPISVVAFTVAEGRIASVDVIVERAVALPEA